MDVQAKIKSLITKLNEQGVPVPMLRDPLKGRPSVSLSMLFISFNVVLIGLIGKWADKLGGIDLTQAIYWFGMCSALYFSRSFSGDGKSQTVSNDEKKE